MCWSDSDCRLKRKKPIVKVPTAKAAVMARMNTGPFPEKPAARAPCGPVPEGEPKTSADGCISRFYDLPSAFKTFSTISCRKATGSS